MSRRHELADDQWKLIEPLLPRNKPRRGRPWADHRTVLNGIFWILKTGAPWRDVPERYGPWLTVYKRFYRWQADGTLDRMLEALQIRLDAKGYIDWDLWAVDGSSVRAHRCAAGAQKGGIPESRTTTHWVAHEAVSEPKSIRLLTATAYPSRSKSRPDRPMSPSTSKT